jgi:hypothetical protein
VRNKCAEYLDLLGQKTWLEVGLNDNLHLQLGPDQRASVNERTCLMMLFHNVNIFYHKYLYSPANFTDQRDDAEW